MNKTERLAYEWLLTQGYDSSGIIFRHRASPDFLTSDSIGWEVKLVRGSVVVFTATQVAAMAAHPGVKLLLWRDGETEPMAVVDFATAEIPGYNGQLHYTIASDDATVRIRTALLNEAKIAAIHAGVPLVDWLSQAVEQKLRPTLRRSKPVG